MQKYDGIDRLPNDKTISYYLHSDLYSMGILYYTVKKEVSTKALNACSSNRNSEML